MSITMATEKPKNVKNSTDTNQNLLPDSTYLRMQSKGEIGGPLDLNHEKMSRMW